jgi:hypothetical protein
MCPKLLLLNHRNMCAPSSLHFLRLRWDTKTVNCAAIKCLLIFCLLWPVLLKAQSSDAIAAANQKKARQILDAAIQALGGQEWLDVRAIRTKGQTAGFYQGKSTGAISDVTITTELPDKQFVDLGGNGRVVQIYVGSQAWEVTYKGKKNLPSAETEDALRWRDHSLRAVLGLWYRNPATVLLDEGQSTVERRIANKVMLVSPTNDAVTLEIDAESHLPSRLSFQWRDPQFHDENLDVVEYDNYQRVDGIATPFTITRTHNGETVRQRYLRSIEYNIALPDGLFDPDRAAARLK